MLATPVGVYVPRDAPVVWKSCMVMPVSADVNHPEGTILGGTGQVKKQLKFVVELKVPWQK